MTSSSLPAKPTIDSRLRQTWQPPGLTYGSLARTLLRLPTFLPFVFIAPAVLTGNGAALSGGVADTLGTSSEMLLLMCLSVTPLITLTGWRWPAPMRQWYGIMFGVSAVTDAVIASVTTTDFAGGPVGRVSGHSFLLTGLVMATIAVPLILTASKRGMRLLGKYWKTLQRLTYVIWGLLVVHLALLSGLLPGEGQEHDGLAFFHQRLYQIVVISLPLVLLRVPPVRKWAKRMRETGHAREMWLVLAPLAAAALVMFFFIEHEFFLKGIGLFELNPVND